MKIRMFLVCLAVGLLSIQVRAQCAAAGSQAPASAAQVDPEKAKAIRHLLEVMGVTKQAGDMLRAMMPQMQKAMNESMKASMANAAPNGQESADAQRRATDYLQKFNQLMQEKMIQKFDALDLAAIYVPVYDKYFSIDDIRAMTGFYESPAGKKMVSSMAPMTADAMGAMMPAIMKMTADIQKEIYAEHPEMDPKNMH